jgi:hypothetical protein
MGCPLPRAALYLAVVEGRAGIESPRPNYGSRSAIPRE